MPQAVVVATLIAICAGVGLPAVTKIREMRNRTQCANHMRSLSLGVLTYRDSHEAYPPATHRGADLPPDRRLSWLIGVLPYVESTDLYRRDGAWDDEPNRSAVVHYPPYVCPTAVDAETTAHTSYLGIAGVGPDAVMLPADHPRAGIFGYDRQTKPDQLTDGEANTVLAVEGAGGPWSRGGSATLRALDPAARPYLGPDRPFGGRHGPRHNLLLADGSVRAVRAVIAPEVLEGLATIAGNESLPADW